MADENKKQSMKAWLAREKDGFSCAVVFAMKSSLALVKSVEYARIS